MAKGAKELGFLTKFGSLYGDIDWNFCKDFENKYGFYFEKIYFENEENPDACYFCPMNKIC
jgi:hypothetical protein